MPNSCWAPRVTEQLTIARLGHRGDGIADTPAGPVYRALCAAGRDGDGRAGRRPSRPPASRSMSTSRATSASTPICKHFGALRRLRHAALVARRISSVETRAGGRGAGAGRRRSRRSSRLIDAHGQGRRRAVLHARRGTHDMLEVGFTAPRAHHIVAIDRCPILAPGLAGAIPAAWAIAEILKPAAQAARHPGDRDRFRHGRGRARLRRAQRRAHDRARRRRREAQARAPHPPRRTGGASARSRC